MSGLRSGEPFVEPVVLLDVPFRPNVEMMRDIAKRLGWGQPAPGPSAMWAKLEPPDRLPLIRAISPGVALSLGR